MMTVPVSLKINHVFLDNKYSSAEGERENLLTKTSPLPTIYRAGRSPHSAPTRRTAVIEKWQWAGDASGGCGESPENNCWAWGEPSVILRDPPGPPYPKGRDPPGGRVILMEGSTRPTSRMLKESSLPALPVVRH
ncbi:MAG: hypothetical protein CVV34_04990 [Methanomicrobiales archaeon HGW-Methanomicrobiales-5]|nr:MAG: hypothetical protein CVV34_04990 [Methanomicrobiales archaeon HGW-Methanomicrobiales-5]